MAYAPLVGQDGGSSAFDLPDEASGIFLSEGLDRLSVICPSRLGKNGGSAEENQSALRSDDLLLKFDPERLWSEQEAF